MGLRLLAFGTLLLFVACGGEKEPTGPSDTLEVEQSATKIVFVTQPMDGVSGEPISPAVVAEVRDANDNLVESSTASVTVAIETNPRGGTLSGDRHGQRDRRRGHLQRALHRQARDRLHPYDRVWVPR